VSDRFDLIVSGGTLAGLSTAIQAKEAGLKRVLLLEAAEEVALPEMIGHHALEVHYQERIEAVGPAATGVEVTTGSATYEGTALVVADHSDVPLSRPPYEVPVNLAGRIHAGTVPRDPRDLDVLVIGANELAVEWSLQLANAGAGVVLALGRHDIDRLSRLARRVLLRLEAGRKATVLWNTKPDGIGELDGLPLAYFDDRRTPDLQFDHIVYVTEPVSPPHPFDAAAISWEPGVEEGTVWWSWDGPGVVPEGVLQVLPGRVWAELRAARFPELVDPYRPAREWRPDDRQGIEALRAEHYNATITHFDRAHSDLWVLRVQPDHGDTSHLPGQYASLGLGYWEPRGDGALEPDLAGKWDRLIRRSYSISSAIFDHNSYLVDPLRSNELEFYIVLVPPGADRVPALTPRLALKQPGDRIYLGPKVAGRYTLTPVTDPGSQVVFLSTGTGEAPHNAMIVELLRKGHFGAIVSVVSVRYAGDLGYVDFHRRLEERFHNYHYLPLTTREPGVEKQYVQDVIREDVLTDRFGFHLDPTRTHVYLCGNPAMIGLPVWEDDRPVFPEPPGVVELLVERGFTLDRRGVRGNLHYEEYW
jgi:ferredoxin--NADP+ reductase